MKKQVFAPLLAGMLLLAAAVSRADVWDQAGTDDDSPLTGTLLAHGFEQAHDLAGVGLLPDQDWFTVASMPRTSYEVIVDNSTGDLDLGFSDVQRLASNGSTAASWAATWARRR